MRFKRGLLAPWQGIGIAATLATLAVLGLRYGGLLQGLEWAAYDQLMRWRSPQTLPRHDRIKLITIDEADLQAGGQALIADRALAQVLRQLSAQDPLVIGLDLYRDLPVPPGTDELTAAFEDIPNVVGIQKVAPPMVAPPEALAADGRAKANDVVLDSDNRIRRGFFFVIDEAGNPVDSFALYLALWWLETEGLTLAKQSEDQWHLGAATFNRFGAFDGGYIRAHPGGYQLLINYWGRGPQFEQIPLREVLAGRLPPGWATDQIVLIGSIAESAKDLYLTPLSGSGSGTLPQPMAGVEIQGQIIAQILDAARGDRPLIKPIPEPLELLWILLWSLIGAALGWRVRRGMHLQARFGKQHPRQAARLSATIGRELQQLLWPLGLVAINLGLAYLALTGPGLWVPVVPTVLSLLLAGMGVVLYTANQAAQLRQLFGRYLTDAVVTNLLEQPEGLQLGGVRQTVTILTSDIRGFTALSEQFNPEAVLTILNLYLEVMLAIIAEYRGTVNAIMGDGLLVFFGAPTPAADDAERAIACALAMQRAMQQVNQSLQAQQLPALEIGIGINTGDCIVGNLGSERYTAYSAIGAQVNLAFRIESCTGSRQILVSESVLAAVDCPLRIDQSFTVHLKGIKDAVTVYEIGGISGPYQLELPPH
ncbi:MAG: adenylate/guanylate cyclase domain-containing protein [Cyanobacteria bacterium P01_G01_bin.54]